MGMYIEGKEKEGVTYGWNLFSGRKQDSPGHLFPHGKQ